MVNKVHINKLLLLSIFLFFNYSCSKGNNGDGKKKTRFLEVLSDVESRDDAAGIFSLDLDDIPDEGLLSALLLEKIDSTGLESYFPTKGDYNSLEEKLKSFYEERDNQIAWINETGTMPQAKELLDAIQNVSMEGLNPEHYNLLEIKNLFSLLKNEAAGQPNAVVELDLFLTGAYFVLASDLSSGRLNPHKFENRWIASEREKGLQDALIEAFEQNSIKKSLSGLLPQHPQYVKLRQTLADYKNLERSHHWDAIEVDSIIQKGDSGEIVSTLKQRLYLFNDLDVFDKESADSLVFDEDMESAVKSFQKRHGLEPDGILGPNSFSKINIPLEDKISQIKLNLERMRWLPEDLGKEYILVNVPEFWLRIYQEDEIVDEMKVIVGREYNSTPIFSDTLEYIAFSPDWTVPVSILRQTLFDDIVKDPTYLERNHYELYLDWEPNSEPVDPHSINWDDLNREEVNFRLVQKPGPWNALGQVKFMMPNNMAIYLHDTPVGHLFNENERGFSHGCIRVERPFALVDFLLKDDPSWNEEKTHQFLNLDAPENVILPQKVPVHIVYKTTWVDENDTVYFLSDIYGHDEIQIISLEKSIKD